MMRHLLSPYMDFLLFNLLNLRNLLAKALAL